jgi:hypothetical protein
VSLIPIEEAWSILGVDYQKIYHILSSKSKSERGETARLEFEKAKKIARSIMVVNHPDKNPGSQEAEDRFKLAASALASIEAHTDKFIESLKIKLEVEKDEFDRRNKNSIFIKIE